MLTYMNRVRVEKVDLISMYSNEKTYVLIIILYKNIFTTTVSSEAVDDVAAVSVFEGSLCNCKFTASPCDVKVTDNHNIISITIILLLFHWGLYFCTLESKLEF